MHADFFRFRCWEVCNELHFVRQINYSVDSLIEWLSTGTGREFTTFIDTEARLVELVETLQQQFSIAATPLSYRVDMTYYFLNAEQRVKPSVRSNDNTHERLEVEVQQDESQYEVAVRRYYP